MKYTPAALIPGILVGILAIIFLTGMITSPPEVKASAPTYAVQNAPQPSTGCQLPESYPESISRWCNWIQDYAGQHNLEPELIAAVMLQESGGNPQAYSKSGAVGLLQVMPRDGIAATFMCPNGPCFGSRPSMDDLFDPEFNIAYGTNMLAGLISKYGNQRDALKAYGPMNVGYYYADIVLGIFNSYR